MVGPTWVRRCCSKIARSAPGPSEFRAATAWPDWRRTPGQRRATVQTGCQAVNNSAGRRAWPTDPRCGVFRSHAAAAVGSKDSARPLTHGRQSIVDRKTGRVTTGIPSVESAGFAFLGSFVPASSRATRREARRETRGPSQRRQFNRCAAARPRAATPHREPFHTSSSSLSAVRGVCLRSERRGAAPTRVGRSRIRARCR